MLNERFLFALSGVDKALLCELAEQDQMSQSAWLRGKMQEEARARGLVAVLVGDNSQRVEVIHERQRA